jgi:hypothetical protein
LFSSNEKKHVKWNIQGTKEKYDIVILNISQNMFICLKSILLIVVHGFILSFFVCGTTFHKWELRNYWSYRVVPMPFVSKSSVDSPIRFKFLIAPILLAPLFISIHQYPYL